MIYAGIEDFYRRYHNEKFYSYRGEQNLNEVVLMWDYRVIEHLTCMDNFFEIHEVYYDEKDNPNSWTERSPSISGDDLEEIAWQLDEMQKCLSKPIIKVREGKIVDE